MTDFLFAASALIGVFFYIAARLQTGRRRIYLPDGFAVMVSVHLIGASILHASLDNSASRFVFEIAAVAVISTMISGCLIQVVVGRGTERAMAVARRDLSVVAMGVVLLANIGIASLILLNSNIRGLVLAAILYNEETMLIVRKAITASTEGYMAPGVIKLVRDVSSPIVICAYVLSCHARQRSAAKSPLYWLTLLAVVVAIFVGGQRFPIIVLLCMLMLAFNTKWATGMRPSQFLMRTIFYAALILAGYAVMSGLLGRTTSDASQLPAPLAAMGSMLERVFVIVPNEAIQSHAFWSPIGPTWGQSWWVDLVTLVPGQKTALAFSSQLHVVAGGSEQGNAPLFFAADSWLAFGLFGVTFIPVLAMSGLYFLDDVLWTYRSPITDACRYLMMINGQTMYSPFLFLLNGGIAVLAVVGAILVASLLHHTRRSPRVYRARCLGTEQKPPLATQRKSCLGT